MFQRPAEHFTCSFLITLMTFGLMLFLIHTHTHLVADICLLPFVFQRMQLGVWWSMLCWMMRVSTWETDSVKANVTHTHTASAWIQEVPSAVSASHRIAPCVMALCVHLLQWLFARFCFINLDVLELLLLPTSENNWVSSSDVWDVRCCLPGVLQEIQKSLEVDPS